MAKFRKLAALCMAFSMIAALGLTACDTTKTPDNDNPSNEQPAFDGYTVTVKMPDGSAAPEGWKLQYCVGDKCYDVAIGAGGIAKFEEKAEGDVYSLKIIFVQSDVEYDYDVITTSPDVKEYVIQLREPQEGDGSQENPYVIKENKTYASNYNAESYTHDYFVYTPAVDGTITLTYAEGTEIVNSYTSVADNNNQVEVMAGIPFAFSVAAYNDEWEGVSTNFTFNFTAAETAFTADGTAYKPYDLTVNEEITETFPEDVYFRYYKFVAPEDGAYMITSSNEYTSFSFTNRDKSPSAGIGYEIKAGEMLILYHDGDGVTWTFNYATDGSIAVTKPGEAEEMPYSVTEACTVNATVKAGESFYVSVEAMLQVTIPEGFIAEAIWSGNQFAAGETYAFEDYNPMQWSTEDSVKFTNVGETDATVAFVFTEYVPVVDENTNVVGKGTQNEPYEFNIGEQNFNSVTSDATNGVIFVYYVGFGGTIEFTNLNNAKIFSASASMAGIMPNEEITSFTVSEMDFMIYFIVYAINDTQPATFNVTFTEAPTESVE